MSIKIAHAVRASAATFAMKVAGDDALQQYTHHILEVADEVTQSPLHLANMLEAIFGDDMAATPLPGTEEKDVSGNQLPDIYTLAETVDGKVKDVEGSWIKDLVHAQPEWLAISANKEGIKLAQKGDANTPAAWAHLSGNKSECEGWLNYWQGKDTKLVNMYRRAFSYWHKAAAINATAGVAVSMITDNDGNLTSSTNALRLTDESDHKDARAHIKDLSLASFERLDLSRLDDPTWMEKAGGNQYMALMATTNRGAKDARPNKIKVNSVNDFDDAMAAVAGWIKAGGTAAYGAVVGAVSKKPEDSDDLVSSIGITYNFLEGVYPKIDNRYARMVARDANKLNAETPEVPAAPAAPAPVAPVVVPPAPAPVVPKPAPVVVGKGKNGKRATA